MRGAVLLATVLLLLAALPSAALATDHISGRVSPASFDVVVLGKDGRATKVHPKPDGRFSVRVRSAKGATLHLLQRGRYVGPVVLRGRPARVALAAARRVLLGTVRARAGYATTSRRVRGSGRPIRTDRAGRPLGAGRLGLVMAPRGVRVAQSAGIETEGTDLDGDGLPNAFDVDDDGDLKLDNIENGTHPQGPWLSLSSALPLEMTETMNVNAGADADHDATIRRFLRLLFVVPVDELGDATRVGVACPFAWCPNANVVIPPGVGQSTTPWEDGDGDGLRDLVRDGPTFTQQIYPRASASEMRPGDTFTVTSDRGASAVSSLAFFFTSSVAVKTLGPYTFTYPVAPGAPGTPGNPVMVPRMVQITFWRPQRPAIAGAEDGTFMDIGGLHYGVDISGAFCRAEDFSDLSATLRAGPGSEAPLVDTAADAPPTGQTMSLTVDTAACEAHGGGDTGGGLPLLSIVAQDVAGDLTRQHIVVQFG